MLIRRVRISERVAEKIQKIHGVAPDEVEEILFSQPIVHQARDGRYLAVGLANRYLTVIFEYEKGTANIVTSYPSSEWQVRLFKRGKRRR